MNEKFLTELSRMGFERLTKYIRSGRINYQGSLLYLRKDMRETGVTGHHKAYQKAEQLLYRIYRLN